MKHLPQKNHSPIMPSAKLIFENKRFVTVNELALILGVSKKTIYGWVYRRLINPKRVGPRLIRFDLDEIEKWTSKKSEDSHGNF